MGHTIGAVIIGVAVLLGVGVTYLRIRSRVSAGGAPQPAERRRQLVTLIVLLVLIFGGLLVFNLIR